MNKILGLRRLNFINLSGINYCKDSAINSFLAASFRIRPPARYLDLGNRDARDIRAYRVSD